MSKRNNILTFEKIQVTDNGAKGTSVAKAPDGRIIFLRNAVAGDIVNIEIYRKKKSYYEGVATHFYKKSNKRVDPVCEHFNLCGGCKWQNISYEHQLYYKEKEVVNQLTRIGNLELPEITPILGCKNIYFYRNKMEFSFSNKGWLTAEQINSKEKIYQRDACGFHISRMWDKILDIKKCYLQEDPSNDIRNFIKSYAIENKLTFFDPREQSGFLRTLMIRISSTSEIMVVIQFFKENKKSTEKLLDAVGKKFPEITSLQYVINKKKNDSLYDQDIINYKGNSYIFEKIEDLQFKIRAKSFYQTNSKQAYQLYKIIKEFARLAGNELVYDLYTGTGTIAQFIARYAKKVIGIESVYDAISDAKENAKINNIENVSFFLGDIKNLFDENFISKHGAPDVIITDPPRVGMHKKVVDLILRIEPKKIVYVSCNVATQARDLSLLKNKYNVVKFQAIDMFPQTYHVENVVLLEKKCYIA